MTTVREASMPSSAYDATYLWTAIVENPPLATRDARLAEAAVAAGVPLVSDG